MKLKNKRVLISGGLAAGGVQTHVSILCKVLLLAGADVTIAATSSNWPNLAIKELQDAGARIIFPNLHKKYTKLNLTKVEALITWPFRLERNFDVLYCHGHGYMHKWMRRFLNSEGMSIYHELIEAPKSGSMMAQVARSMDIIIAPTETLAGQILDACGPCRIVAIPFFSQSYLISNPIITEPIGGRELRVAYFGRLVKHKQPDWLVYEWKNIRKKIPLFPARLDVYGNDFPDDPMLESLRKYIIKEGIDKEVMLHGAYDHNDYSLLARTDLVLLPSKVEGLPLVLLEAVQHGVPFVAMEAGGIASLLENNPDVMVTPISKDKFLTAIYSMAHKLRNGQIDRNRLSTWARSKYGYQELSKLWINFIFDCSNGQ